MAIVAYSTDEDLLEIRSNILSLGVDSWEEQHQKAFGIINRAIINKWYKEAAKDYSLDYRDAEFSPDLVEEGFLTELSCYKTLELIYLQLMKDSPQQDGFGRNREIFRDLYNEELREILASGISYDWDGDSSIVDTEKYQRVPRRLTRV